MPVPACSLTGLRGPSATEAPPPSAQGAPQSTQNRWGRGMAAHAHLIVVLIVKVHGLEHDLIEAILGRGEGSEALDLLRPVASMGPGEPQGARIPDPKPWLSTALGTELWQGGQCQDSPPALPVFSGERITCFKFLPASPTLSLMPNPLPVLCSPGPHNGVQPRGLGSRCLASLLCHQYAQ